MNEKKLREEFVSLLNRLDKKKLDALYYMLIGYMQGKASKNK